MISNNGCRYTSKVSNKKQHVWRFTKSQPLVKRIVINQNSIKTCKDKINYLLHKEVAFLAKQVLEEYSKEKLDEIRRLIKFKNELLLKISSSNEEEFIDICLENDYLTKII
jgi:hypothetical protein